MTKTIKAWAVIDAKNRIDVVEEGWQMLIYKTRKDAEWHKLDGRVVACAITYEVAK